jgi:hypothetical protein
LLVSHLSSSSFHLLAQLEPFFSKNEPAEEYDTLLRVLSMQHGSASSDLFFQDGFYTSFDFSAMSSEKGLKGAIEGGASQDQKLNRAKLQNALLRRAMEAVRRSQVLAGEKGCIMKLNASGALSETFVDSFLRAEKETTDENFIIRHEAEILKPGTPLVFP